MTRAVAGKRIDAKASADQLDQLAPPLLAVTLVTATAELVLLRLVSRIGVHIPAMGWARGGYSVAVSVGNLVFPVAAVFVVALLAMLALTIARRSPLTAAAVLALLAYQVWRLAMGRSEAGVGQFQVLLVAALLFTFVTAVQVHLGRGPLAFLTLVVAGQVLSLVQAAPANLTGGAATLPLAVAAAGEVLLLAALLLAPVLLSPPSWPRAALVMGLAAVVLTGGALAGNPSTAHILALWTFGVSMPVPALLYVVAAGTLTATALANARAGRGWTAAGIALLALGGYGPPNSYQAGLLLAGVLTLVLPAALTQRALQQTQGAAEGTPRLSKSHP
jgi:hypothetical protein